MIYLVWGAPRDGKTYFVTGWAVKKLLAGKKVISNYPIIWRINQNSIFRVILNRFFALLRKKNLIYLYPDKILSSFVWRPEMVYEGITDALVIQDEAYREVSSRDWKKFDKDKHTFYATNGHNGNDIVVIAQDPQRVDTVIREMVNVFYHCRKLAVPFVGYPLVFTICGYLSEEAISANEMDSKEFVRFSRRIGRAYDTHYFRSNKKPPVLIRWATALGLESADSVVQPGGAGWSERIRKIIFG